MLPAESKLPCRQHAQHSTARGRSPRRWGVHTAQRACLGRVLQLREASRPRARALVPCAALKALLNLALPVHMAFQHTPSCARLVPCACAGGALDSVHTCARAPLRAHARARKRARSVSLSPSLCQCIWTLHSGTVSWEEGLCVCYLLSEAFAHVHRGAHALALVCTCRPITPRQLEVGSQSSSPQHQGPRSTQVSCICLQGCMVKRRGAAGGKHKPTRQANRQDRAGIYKSPIHMHTGGPEPCAPQGWWGVCL